MLIRPFQVDDLSAVLLSFKQAFGTSRTLEEWRWRYEQNPYGSSIEVALGEDGRLLAHYAVLHGAWQHSKDPCSVGQVVDVFTGEKPGLFRRGPLARTIDSLLARATGPGKLLWLYGFPNRRAARLGRLTEVYPWEASVPCWSAPKTSRHPRARGWLQVGWDRTGIESLWDRARERYPFSSVRDARFYEHRFRTRPAHDYLFFAWRRSGVIRALAVLDPRSTTPKWVDLLWDGRDPGDLTALQLEIQTLLPGVELWLHGDLEAALVLEAAGWTSTPHPEARLVARSFVETVPHDRFASAYLTLADSDLA